MLEALGILLYAPWIYVVIVLSILLDVFLPVLPSGAVVVAAATLAAGAAADVAGLPAPHANAHLPELFLLALCAAAASVLGDLAAYRLARHGSRRYTRLISRSRRLTAAQQRLGLALVRGGGPLVVLARFAPAGRAVVSLGAGVSHRRAMEFLPWSAVAAVAWSAYSVGLGYLGAQLLGASWIATGLSLVALAGAGLVAARLLRGAHPDRPTPV
ncbi:VTT domain-containing protein [Streptomyces aidingensis]|uniref:Membrane protein DedA, SNARE-associated domain n=1 Tax=Streptomyces aidingensis TaxID=910347 RepID=A0A1I1L3J5_9ACTN|nr:VTT domain-containing protein [Streptomyces aidingensis]SFC67515.1 membrane protein DedA, SNARE-associated domain [Streptomyces aidingensis]